ncbi:MAG: DUF349 domain-containing protein [Bacteroidales bacterium]|jgi:hypothetical protein|nr:DUF349 domain-containing protein [Bacteroidales bacterium]
MENQVVTNPMPDNKEKAEEMHTTVAAVGNHSSQASTESINQINEKETELIRNLIRSDQLPVEQTDTPDAEEIPQPSEAAEVTEQKPVISKEEQLEIRELIAPDQEPDEETQEEEEGVSEHDFAMLNKLQLVELLEETVQEPDITLIKNKVAAVKVYFLKLNKEDIEQRLEKFLAEGGERDSFEHTEDPLETRFKAAFNLYKENKARYNELLERQKAENLVAKQAILEELKQLIASEETLKKTYDEFKALQERWKEIGQVPAGEISNLWNNYHFLVEKFFDKVKINRELRDLDMKKNLELKIELCEKTEELLLEQSIIKAFKTLQKYHDEWKEIGPVPQDKKEEVWERFKTASDKINAIRREHYEKIQQEQQANYETKQALCEKAEELLNELPESINQWMKRSDEMSELFKVWRTVGQTSRKQNDEIWARFKTAMDAFFESKKEFFNKLKEQQIENYNRKLDLCVQVEALKDSSEWRKTTDQLIAIQKEWKKIGPVPRKHSDRIWKRFRAACDEFFNRKSEYFSSIREREDENLQKKRQLIEEISAFEIKDDRSANLDAVKLIQRQWLEIGHVPIKVKDQLYAEYRAAVDKLFERMKLTVQERVTASYKNVVDQLREEPDANDRIRRERNNLNNKIGKLKEEILLLENNIGFFATSKQADLMKAEYEKKIVKAIKEVVILEAKLKMLRG